MRKFRRQSIIDIENQTSYSLAGLSTPGLIALKIANDKSTTVVVHMSWQLRVFRSQAALGNRIFGGGEELDCDFSSRFGNRDFEKFDAAYFWIGTRNDLECIFGSIGVVFLIGYLVCSDFGGYACCQLIFNSLETGK